MKNRADLLRMTKQTLSVSLVYAARAEKLRDIQFEIYRKLVFLPVYTSVAGIALFGTAIARSNLDAKTIAFLLPSMWAYFVSFVIGLFIVLIVIVLVHLKEQQFTQSSKALEITSKLEVLEKNRDKYRTNSDVEEIDEKYLMLDEVFEEIMKLRSNFDKLFLWGRFILIVCFASFCFGTIFPLVQLSNLTVLDI